MKSHGINPTPECPLFSKLVPDFCALEQVIFPSAHTVLLIAADASDISTETISRIAQKFLAAGLVQVCVWGPDCERVHDILDEVHIGDGSTEPAFTLMSFWHSNESLEDAIWFFLTCAFPYDNEIDTTSYVAVTVGETDWAHAVDGALSDLPAFHLKRLGEELQ